MGIIKPDRRRADWQSALQFWRVDPARRATVAYYIAFMGLGLVSASLGATLPTLAAQIGVDLSQISYVISARSLGFMIGSFVVGRSYDRVAGHPILVGMLLLIGGMMLLAPTASLLWLLAGVLLVVGIGQGSVDVGGNTLLVWQHGRRVGPYMNGLHFIWGVGAFLSPLLIAWAIQMGGHVGWAYWLLAGLVFLSALPLVRLPSPRPASSESSDHNAPIPLLTVGLITLFFFVYVGSEVSMANWIYTYALRMGLLDPIGAAYLNSALFGSLTAARLLSIPLAARLRPRIILGVDLAICLAGVLLILLLPTSLTVLWIGVVAVGIGMASLFPTMLDLAQRFVPLTGRVTSWFFLGASAGGMTLPWIVGQFIESAGPWVLLIAVLIGFGLAAGILGVLVALRSIQGVK